MRLLFVLAVFTVYAVFQCEGAIKIRHRRQLEKEDNDVVVIQNNRPGPSVPSYSHDAFDLNFDENTGAFSLGGRLPTLCCHHNHGISFSDLFESLQRRFDEMTRAMASVPAASGNGTSINDYPDGYNKTETQIVEFGGRKYLKKTTIIKKGSSDAAIFIKSTIFEPLDENVESTSVSIGESDSTNSVVTNSPSEPVKPVTVSSVPTNSPTTSTASTPDSTGLEREELTTPTSN